MSTFRLLVFANATVAHNQKLSCAATTMRELEQAVQAELGLGFPVWIFQRDPDFGDDFVKVTDLLSQRRQGQGIGAKIHLALSKTNG